MKQSQALEILKTGGNVFLTGEPGSGKTYVINQFVKYLFKKKINVAITASTGIAATHINGRTIHSWAGIGIKEELTKADLNAIVRKKYITERIAATKVLIIDEVSMLSANTLTMVDVVCRKVMKNQNPFGGMQVVLVGDFFQLSPVVKPRAITIQETMFERPDGVFVYHADVWHEMNMQVCYLMEQYRQDDLTFLSILSAIRNGTFENEHLQEVKNRCVSLKDTPPDALKFFPHNADVERLNSQCLAKLPGKSKNFFMSSFGDNNVVNAMKKNCLSPELLSLKLNTVVMFTKNNQKENFVNGTVGVVKGFDSTGSPIVATKQSREIVVKPVDWILEERGEAVAHITQLPLRLAWAITVHKSQGMSLDEAVMDLSKVFEFGQGYVALSRIRRLSGLYLLGWNDIAFKVSDEALEKDMEFRKMSGEAEAVLEK